jgi:hypothetical protein
MENAKGQQLGFCDACFRVRWLATVGGNEGGQMPHGTCRTCAREAGPEGGGSMLRTISSQNFSPRRTEIQE